MSSMILLKNKKKIELILCGMGINHKNGLFARDLSEGYHNSYGYGNCILVTKNYYLYHDLYKTNELIFSFKEFIDLYLY